ncbi:hypothetical protein D0A34_05140 [Microcoleus vaginatus PCC 9802]|nr:hypothetical protein D0A34_05140 [Microcoleus vaginatus PCC 9802]
MTIYYQKVKGHLYLHRRGINEYKFNHRPINCRETARRRVLILGNIKFLGIGIIHLSIPFVCALGVLCGLIIPIQPESI